MVTKHYVICTSARRQYAQWCGALFERLYLSFHNYWKQRGMKLAEPEFPLVALVTRASARELDLSEGRRVTAAFKASAVHLITR